MTRRPPRALQAWGGAPAAHPPKADPRCCPCTPTPHGALSGRPHASSASKHDGWKRGGWGAREGASRCGGCAVGGARQTSRETKCLAANTYLSVRFHTTRCQVDNINCTHGLHLFDSKMETERQSQLTNMFQQVAVSSTGQHQLSKLLY